MIIIEYCIEAMIGTYNKFVSIQYKIGRINGSNKYSHFLFVSVSPCTISFDNNLITHYSYISQK